MDDLIKAHGWVMNEQNFLRLKDSDYQLSIIPTFTYWSRDKNDMLFRSKTPTGMYLNIALFRVCINAETKNVSQSMCMITDVDSEEDFYDFMISIQKQVAHEQAA
jgi:hypothetical protein